MSDTFLAVMLGAIALIFFGVMTMGQRQEKTQAYTDYEAKAIACHVLNQSPKAFIECLNDE